MASDPWTDSLVDEPAQPRSNRRLVLWLALVVPVLGYLLVVPVRARLDRGVIERHLPYEIWEAMVDGLPGVEADWLIEVAFVAGGLLFLAGTLVLIWLALDENQPIAELEIERARAADDAPDDEAMLQPAT